jgi:hypothetical protein
VSHWVPSRESVTTHRETSRHHLDARNLRDSSRVTIPSKVTWWTLTDPHPVDTHFEHSKHSISNDLRFEECHTGFHIERPSEDPERRVGHHLDARHLRDSSRVTIQSEIKWWTLTDPHPVDTHFEHSKHSISNDLRFEECYIARLYREMEHTFKRGFDTPMSRDSALGWTGS